MTVSHFLRLSTNRLWVSFTLKQWWTNGVRNTCCCLFGWLAFEIGIQLWSLGWHLTHYVAHASLWSWSSYLCHPSSGSTVMCFQLQLVRNVPYVVRMWLHVFISPGNVWRSGIAGSDEDNFWVIFWKNTSLCFKANAFSLAGHKIDFLNILPCSKNNVRTKYVLKYTKICSTRQHKNNISQGKNDKAMGKFSQKNRDKNTK